MSVETNFVVIAELMANERESENGLIVLNMSWLLLDLRGRVANGKTQLLPPPSCNWLGGCCAIQLVKV